MANRLKAGTLGSDEDGGGGAGEDGQEGGSAEGTLDQKIARFEALIGKLHTVVDMMEEEEDGEPVCARPTHAAPQNARPLSYHTVTHSL
jgi:hypothetical protein